MFADLEWLIKLQKLDREIYQITGERRTAESNIRRLEVEIEEVLLTRIKHVRLLNELRDEKEAKLEDVADHERILEQKKADLENDKKTKKEHIRREILKLEQAVIVFTEKVDKIDLETKKIEKQIKVLDQKHKELNDNKKSEEKKVVKLVKKSKKELGQFQKKREIIEKNIRKPFLNHYNRIMKIRNGVAITFVSDKGLCNGCKIHVPFQFQQKIRKMNDYNICEGCGRILVVKDAIVD